MPAGRHRTSANAPDKATVSVNERILKECHDLYIDNEKGMMTSSFAVYHSSLFPFKLISIASRPSLTEHLCARDILLQALSFLTLNAHRFNYYFH